MLRDVFNFGTWKHQKRSISRDFLSQKRSKSARRPQFSKFTTSKTKQFCETSSIMEECRADGLVPMRFAIFPVHVSKVLCLPRKREARPYEVLHLSRRINTPEDLMLQNATPLRKSALWPPNISDEPCLLYCACHAACIFADPLQVSHACQRFWNCHKTLTSCSLARCQIPCACHAKPHCNFKKGSETLRNPQFLTLLSCDRASCHNAVRLLNISTSKSCSEHGVLLAFWLRNVLRATAPCTFWTSQLPKDFRSCGVLYILTSNCASRHNGVRFFHITTSKSAPDVRCF